LLSALRPPVPLGRPRAFVETGRDLDACKVWKVVDGPQIVDCVLSKVGNYNGVIELSSDDHRTPLKTY
jgi:hypothetical protein